jgi:hypothetical protein
MTLFLNYRVQECLFWSPIHIFHCHKEKVWILTLLQLTVDDHINFLSYSFYGALQYAEKRIARKLRASAVFQ